ncbi:hypothetical protein [Cohnella rhizosphaerae]|uniref:Uncharacterized protein n=1 Tax=Cohnella rhizosphaerae TaxID=1457232 RepID=A0A9X4KSE8_9BACL|nr:hypothetical protein [Cohnella rhizosphaerae]MDG0810075.1 hypothetical protein [Cohnella rhizosphaerae]
MSRQLIEQGKQLAGQVREGGYGRMITGPDFEKWAAATSLFIEQNFNGTTIAAEATEAYRTRGTNSASKYETLLAILEVAVENKEKQDEAWDAFSDLNS